MIPLKPGLGTRALGMPVPMANLGCAPCRAMQKQKEANEEFARRYGVVRDPRVPVKEVENS
jgi:hypothetical protein